MTGQSLDAGGRVLEVTGPALFTGGGFGLEGGLVGTIATLAGVPIVLAVAKLLGRRQSRYEPGE